MTRRSDVFLKQLVLVIDVATIVAAFFCAYYARQHVHSFYRLDLVPGAEVFQTLQPLDRYLSLLLVLLPVWIGMLYFLGAYRELRVKSSLKIAWIMLRACALSLLIFGAVVFLLKLHYISRSFIGLFFLLSFCLLSLERVLLIGCFHVMLRRGYFHRNLLIVGAGPRAVRLIQTLQGHTGWGVRIVGVLDDEPSRAVRVVGRYRIGGVQVVGTLAELPGALRRFVVDEVIFAVPRGWLPRIEQAILECELAGVRATVAVDLFNTRFARAHPWDLEGRPLISFDTTPTDQWQLAIKRALDVAITGIGLLVLLPLFPLVAAMVKCTSPGPVLFRQIRCGLNGRRFTLYKFRSMVDGAEAKQATVESLNELKGPVFKAANDPRLTAVGRWIRKMSIDEVPQLFNVLKGEMSLVGPRPPLPVEVEQYAPWQRRRLSMRPGITGYWQVNGRNHLTDFDEWMELDLKYIDRWSLGLDAKILLKTIPAVVSGRGAK